MMLSSPKTGNWDIVSIINSPLQGLWEQWPQRYFTPWQCTLRGMLAMMHYPRRSLTENLRRYYWAWRACHQGEYASEVLSYVGILLYELSLKLGVTESLYQSAVWAHTRTGAVRSSGVPMLLHEKQVVTGRIGLHNRKKQRFRHLYWWRHCYFLSYFLQDWW